MYTFKYIFNDEYPQRLKNKWIAYTYNQNKWIIKKKKEDILPFQRWENASMVEQERRWKRGAVFILVLTASSPIIFKYCRKICSKSMHAKQPTGIIYTENIEEKSERIVPNMRKYILGEKRRRNKQKLKNHNGWSLPKDININRALILSSFFLLWNGRFLLGERMEK